MKWKQIDTDNIPNTPVLAIELESNIMVLGYITTDINGDAMIRTESGDVVFVDHYIDPDDIVDPVMDTYEGYAKIINNTSEYDSIRTILDEIRNMNLDHETYKCSHSITLYSDGSGFITIHRNPEQKIDIQLILNP